MTDEQGWKLRKGRFSEQGRIYFVTACCFDRRRHFSTCANASIVVEELSARCPQLSYRSLAFVVMPDHAHWLVQLTSTTKLGTVVGRMKGRSAFRINQARRSKIKVWQAGFHDRALRKDEDVVEAGQYLIHNPSRAGLVVDVDEYPYWGSVWHERGMCRD